MSRRTFPVKTTTLADGPDSLITSLSEERCANPDGDEVSRVSNSSVLLGNRNVSGVEILLQLLEDKKETWQTAAKRRIEQEERGTLLFYKMMKEGATKQQQLSEIAKSLGSGGGEGEASHSPPAKQTDSGGDEASGESLNTFEEEKSKLMPSAQAFFKKDGGPLQDSSENVRLSFLRDSDVILPLPAKVARWDGTSGISIRSSPSWEEVLLVALRTLANCSIDSASFPPLVLSNPLTYLIHIIFLLDYVKIVIGEYKGLQLILELLGHSRSPKCNQLAVSILSNCATQGMRKKYFLHIFTNVMSIMLDQNALFLLRSENISQIISALSNSENSAMTRAQLSQVMKNLVVVGKISTF